MKDTEIKKEIAKGEDSFRQFKEKFSSIDQLTAEIVAFANSQGGHIFIGVNDEGRIFGIEQADIKRLNQWISNVTSQKIEPPLFVQTQNALIDDKLLMLIMVPQGENKPYCANKSDYWVKTGADKRRASREELFRLMQASSRLYADEMATEHDIEELDLFYFSEAYKQIFDDDVNELEIPKQQLLQNLKLAKGDKLTLAGIMLFGRQPQFARPQFSIKATCYFDENEYRDKEDIAGKLLEQHRKGVDFVTRNLHRLPVTEGFNEPSQIEIPKKVISEAVANALAHRDYFISAPVFIDVFPDRIEITSPGVLPNTLTVENIKLGIHIERNPVILSFMARFPQTGYSGRGSGIPRMIRMCRDKNLQIEFINDVVGNRFKVVVMRPVSYREEFKGS